MKRKRAADDNVVALEPPYKTRTFNNSEHDDAPEESALPKQETVGARKAGVARMTKSERKAAARQAKSERRSKKRARLIEETAKAAVRKAKSEERARKRRIQRGLEEHASGLAAEPDFPFDPSTKPGVETATLALDDVPPTTETAARQAVLEKRAEKKRIRRELKSKSSGSTVQSSLPTVPPAKSETGVAVPIHSNNSTSTDAVPKVVASTAAPRFVCFVGNLPYTATTKQLISHFSKLTPLSIRHSTDKSTGASRGFAFLEFDNYDKMKTCLKLYHHSMFDPEKQTASAPEQGEEGTQEMAKLQDDLQLKSKDLRSRARRINVELTAGGGGGKSGVRKEKIKTKNKRLEEQRERTPVKDAAEKQNARQKGDERVGIEASKTAIDSIRLMDRKQIPGIDNGAVHPSRLSRVGQS